uniref:Putative secreted protein n=1 Tax=Anopheles marajoara TaxID=58244 RepID=A0A2M4C6F3_9DIPT
MHTLRNKTYLSWPRGRQLPLLLLLLLNSEASSNRKGKVRYRWCAAHVCIFFPATPPKFLLDVSRHNSGHWVEGWEAGLVLCVMIISRQHGRQCSGLSSAREGVGTGLILCGKISNCSKEIARGERERERGYRNWSRSVLYCVVYFG